MDMIKISFLREISFFNKFNWILFSQLFVFIISLMARIASKGKVNSETIMIMLTALNLLYPGT